MKSNILVRTSAILVSAFALAVVVTACSQTQPEGEADRSLVWATPTPLGTLDVVADQVSGPARRLLVGNVLEGLTRIVDEGEGRLSWEPLLATEWERVDATHWQFTLRDGVAFSDGEPLAVEDVVYSLNKIARPDSAKDTTVEVIAGARAIDDSVVEIETKVPTFFLDRALAGVGIQPDGWGEDGSSANDETVGTGPYVLDSISAGHDQATLVRSEDYWGEQPYFDSIQMRVIPDAGARLAALNAGEIDVAFDLPPDLLSAAPTTITTGSTEVESLRLSDAGPLADLRLREAVSYAVDSQALVDNVRQGFANVASGQGVTSQVHGFNPELEAYPFDPERASELVEEAGAVGTVLSLMCTSDYYGTAGVDTCQALASDFEAIGLKVDVQLLPRDQAAQQGLLAPKNGTPAPDMLYIHIGSGTMDSTPYLQQYLTCEPIRATFCDEDLKSRIEAAFALTDEIEQAAAFEEIHAEARELAPFVWITTPKVAAATAAGVSGQLYSDASTVYWAEWSRD